MNVDHQQYYLRATLSSLPFTNRLVRLLPSVGVVNGSNEVLPAPRGPLLRGDGSWHRRRINKPGPGREI